MWVDYNEIERLKMPFNFIIGPRGGGKTYGAIHLLDKKYKRKGIWMRRTQTEIDLMLSKIRGDDFKINTFEDYGIKNGLNMDVWRINKQVGAFGNIKNDEQAMWGHLVALSTLSNIRGFSGSYANILVYDEFIAESHRKQIKNEAEAFLNAYETINRNREFEGKDPIKTYLLSNSNSLQNAPILYYLNLIEVIRKMKKDHKFIKVLPKRGVTITLTQQLEFVEKKKITAIGKLTEGTSYATMAFDNDFAYDDFSYVESKNIKNYKPVCQIAGITMMVSLNSSFIYFTVKSYNNIRNYHDFKDDIIRYNMDYGRKVYQQYLMGNVYFQNYAIKIKILDIIS